MTISCPSGNSDTGAFQITWSGPHGATYVLREGDHAIYQGTELATAITGRNAGTYEYSITTHDSDGAAATCAVTVEPPPLSLAFGLFGLGFVVFAATLALLLIGHRAVSRAPGTGDARGTDSAQGKTRGAAP